MDDLDRRIINILEANEKRVEHAHSPPGRRE